MVQKDQLTQMRGLYSRLKSAGVARKYVQGVLLPSWWDDGLAKSPAGFAEGVGYIAKALGVSPSVLRDAKTPLSAHGNSVQYKKRRGVEADELSWATAIALRAATLAARAMSKPVVEIPSDPLVVREELLRDGDFIGFVTLLDYCWDRGIPVLHVSKFPQGKKMDGLATSVDGRPVIVLSKNAHSPGWLLFILAHELGHIGRGHCVDGAMVDKTVGGTGKLERQATEYGLCITAGEPKPEFRRPRGGQYPNRLAAAALDHAARSRVAPATVLLSWGHKTKEWGRTNAALKLVEGTNDDALALVRTRMYGRLQMDRLSDDECEFFERVCGSE